MRPAMTIMRDQNSARARFPMLSYRHAFHAGNHADILKHAVLVHALGYLHSKDKPLRIVDTHSGAGSYRLHSSMAQKTGEFEAGIGKLWQLAQGEPLPPLMAEFLAQVKACNPGPQLTRYPGSPQLIQQLLRPQDRYFAHELHPTDYQQLRELLAGDKRVKVINEDGFAGLQGLVPPPDRRALVLIDPSYEVKSDYYTVVKQLQQAYKRFATGSYALWYPVVERARIDELEHSLKKSGIRNIQLCELAVKPDGEAAGMTASGMILINPPWTLWQQLELALPWLVDHFAQAPGAFYRLEQLVAE